MKKLTIEDYKKKLLDNNIDIIPLDDYLGMHTKIKHKCICNNTWNISPNNVLSGKKCGCIPSCSPSSNNTYLKKILKNNIDIIPLEDYITATTKILHKCTCDNIWKVVPSKVLNGAKCGCMKYVKYKKTNSEYIKDLKDKNILIEPLEDYKGGHSKILHKCTCGNTWKVAPSKVKCGHHCGCLFTQNRVDLYKDRKTILYYIKVNQYYKIGICLFKNSLDNSINQRFKSDIKLGVGISILKSKIFEDGSQAYLTEQSIIKEFKEYLYKGDSMNWFGGHTELFDIDINALNQMKKDEEKQIKKRKNKLYK